MPSEFTTFRRHVLSPPGRSSPEGQQGCNVLDGRASQHSVRRYRDGELGVDVNFISEINRTARGSGTKQEVLICVPVWKFRYGVKDDRSVPFPSG